MKKSTPTMLSVKIMETNQLSGDLFPAKVPDNGDRSFLGRGLTFLSMKFLIPMVCKRPISGTAIDLMTVLGGIHEKEHGSFT